MYWSPVVSSTVVGPVVDQSPVQFIGSILNKARNRVSLSLRHSLMMMMMMMAMTGKHIVVDSVE